MLRFLADENFNRDIVRGLLLRQPGLDIARVQDVRLGEADDSVARSSRQATDSFDAQ